MDWFIVIGVVGVFGGWLTIMVVWGLTGRVKGRTAGIGPFFKQVGLEDDEAVIAELGAICHIAVGAYGGMLAFTNRRLIFLPKRELNSTSAQSIDYAKITDWRLEKRRHIGAGVIVPLRAPALVVNTADGRHYVFWAALGYDIVRAANQALASARAKPSSE